jgi:hypothetical protein
MLHGSSGMIIGRRVVVDLVVLVLESGTRDFFLPVLPVLFATRRETRCTDAIFSCLSCSQKQKQFQDFDTSCSNILRVRWQMQR